jgi:thiamine-phosphate pyrophosphorylase
MLPEVTPAVARAFAAAAGHAFAAGQLAVNAHHVFYGLLAEEEGRAFLVAVAAGLDIDRYRSTIPVTAEVPAGTSIPLGPTARIALTTARRLARENAGEDDIPSDTLLLALLRSDEVLNATATALGLQADRLEAIVLPASAAAVELHEPLDLARAGPDASLARLLDAAANRAREGLRVAEDYCRFVLDDALLCAELKTLRHDLTAALAALPADALLQSRDTPGDVGTSLTTAAEAERGSPADVARASLKRLQEALRSLEEFGKIVGPDVGRSLEQLRYRSYTLEKAILTAGPARERLRDARLYLLATGAACLGPLDRTIAEALDGGVDVVQLREKTLNDRDFLERARQVRRWTRQAGVLFIVNDRVDIALLSEADGVHLGQDDLPVAAARRLLGPDMLVGVSTHDINQLRQAVLNGASYLGIGPTFPSNTKGFSALAGLDYVREATAATSLPAFILGGVDASNIDRVVAAGGRRVAVSRAILQSESPRATAMELRRRMKIYTS